MMACTKFFSRVIANVVRNSATFLGWTECAWASSGVENATSTTSPAQPGTNARSTARARRVCFAMLDDLRPNFPMRGHYRGFRGARLPSGPRPSDPQFVSGPRPPDPQFVSMMEPAR